MGGLLSNGRGGNAAGARRLLRCQTWHRSKEQRSVNNRVWLLGSGLACVRLGALWLLVSREWSHQQSLSTLPLILLLFPEGLLLPAPMIWTLRTALFFSAVLVVGSFTAVALFGLAVGWLKYPCRK